MTIQRDPPHSANLRKGRRSISGWPYFVTKRVSIPNTDCLIRPECARLVIESFQWAAQRHWWVNLGFVVMPDHYHLILGLGNTKTLSDAIKSINKFTGRRINALIGNEGRFWQEGFYDHAIRNRKEFDSILACAQQSGESWACRRRRALALLDGKRKVCMRNRLGLG